MSQCTGHVSNALSRKGQCSGPGFRRLEESTVLLFEFLLKCFRDRDDGKPVGEATASSHFSTYTEISAVRAKFQSSNVDLVSCIFTFRGIFLLIVIAVFLSVYIHLFSNYDRLTCSAQLRRRPCHRFVILPFQGLQLLVAVIVLAMAFAKPAQAQNGCEPGWIPYASSLCLKISKELLTWRQAEDACSSQGAHLLSIDREHKDFSRYLFRHYKLKKLFIGLIGTPAPNGAYTYRWSDGSPFVYSNWNNLNFHCKTELCVAVIPRWSAASAFHYRMSWSVVSCLSRNRFICEKPRNRVKTDVRLVDGVTPNRGRLEIFVDGEWSRVCIGSNRMRTAFAVCQHLNYRSPLFVRALNRSTEEMRKNFSHIVECTWNEALSCTYDRATCEVEIFLSCQSARTRSIRVRLVGGKWSRNGLLEVSTDWSWKKAFGIRLWIDEFHSCF
ncbi:uncharacterized protein [Oscarella lobularis]|uniref:uncharacterized protein n=1 Tax=Oscarella lobularis TaxID=121494 RepID=UPI00331334EF